jgi:hypothetical protein
VTKWIGQRNCHAVSSRLEHTTFDDGTVSSGYSYTSFSLAFIMQGNGRKRGVS